MAGRKQTILQRDMRAMEVREDLLERDDSEVRQVSVKGARNMRPLVTGVAQARDGTVYRNTRVSSARAPIEIKPGDGLTFGVEISDDKVIVLNEQGGREYTQSTVPWTDASAVWVVPNRETTLIGGEHGIQQLVYDEGTWTLSDWTFTESFGDEVAQPYWVFNKDVTLTPSATTGNITVTASEPVFSSDYVGLRIRYARREIEITGYISDSVLEGTVVNELFRTWNIWLHKPEGFRVNDVVTTETGFEGVIVGRSDPYVTVVGLNDNEPVEAGGTFLSGPDATSATDLGFSSTVSPGPTTVWDEPMMSDVRGWPRAAFMASGRLGFLNFPEIPNGIAISSARDIRDFIVGAEDDDAIARTVGENAPRLLHAVNAADLLLFSSSGCYLVNTRDNGLITPATFAPIKFDYRGCSTIPPVEVNDGVVFIEANGNTLSAALLDGNVYLKWSVRPLSTLHSHLINSPVALCGPSLSAGEDEKFVFVVNADGTLAVLSYTQSLSDPAGVGAAPWDTDGEFKDISPCFGSYWTVVDRTINGSEYRFLESFESGIYVDCAFLTDSDLAQEVLEVNGNTLEANGVPLTVNAAINHLRGDSVWIYESGYAHGPFEVDADGLLVDAPELVESRQIGLNYTAELAPWPLEVIESPRVGTLDVSVVTFMIAVQDTGYGQIRCNSHTRDFDTYNFGDPLNAPPPVRTKVYRVPVFGRRYSPDLAIIKSKPGPFRILYTGQEVQI